MRRGLIDAGSQAVLQYQNIVGEKNILQNITQRVLRLIPPQMTSPLKKIVPVLSYVHTREHQTYNMQAVLRSFELIPMSGTIVWDSPGISSIGKVSISSIDVVFLG